MKFAVNVGVFMLALVLVTVPATACLLPNVTLRAAERECCKQMASQCGHAGMAGSHSCCQQLAGPDSSAYIGASSAQLDHLVNISWFLPVSAPLSLTANQPVHLTSDLGIQGPPGSPPIAVSVLRI